MSNATQQRAAPNHQSVVTVTVEESCSEEREVRTRRSSLKTASSTRTTFTMNNATDTEDNVEQEPMGAAQKVFYNAPVDCSGTSHTPCGNNSLMHLSSVASTVSTVSTMSSATSASTSTGYTGHTLSTNSVSSSASGKRPPSVAMRVLLFPVTVLHAVFNVLFSISFTILAITVAAVLIPSLVLWKLGGKDGMSVLQNEFLRVSVTDSCDMLQFQLQSKLERCEQSAWSYAQFLNSLPDVGKKKDMAQLYTYLWSSITLLTTSTCGNAVDMTSRGGVYTIVLNNALGSRISTYANRSTIQTGFPPNATAYDYPLNMTTYLPIMTNGLKSSRTAGYLSMISASVIAKLSDRKNIVWGDMLVMTDYIAMKLMAGWLTYDGQLRGAFQLYLKTTDLGAFLQGSIRDGTLCAYVADYTGCLIASNCEDVIFNNTLTGKKSRKCLNQTIDEFQEAFSLFTENHLAGQNVTSVFFSDHNSSVVYGITNIITDAGFTAMGVVIGDKEYFFKTYRNARHKMVLGVAVAISGSTIIALAVALLTFTAVWQVIKRIHHIMDIGLGKKKSEKEKHSLELNPVRMLSANAVVTQNAEASADDDAELPQGTQEVEKQLPKNTFNKRSLLSKLNLVSYMSEIRAILKKLDWLEGKVLIISKFLPVVSKLVCKQGVSDEQVLNSKLARRQGSYMFVDIEGFTPLCEAVTPDVAGLVLESFYDAVEKAAHEHCNVDDVLIKRLGDGVLVCWGFKLSVERNETARRLPIISYAAAVRLGELAFKLDKHITEIVKDQAPWWRCTVRCGITTGPALHGLLRTDALMNPDVIGALINLAARCQTVGKLPLVKQLGQKSLSNIFTNDRVLCTVITDMATASANASAATAQHPGVGRGLHKLAKQTLSAHPAHVIERVPVVGVGEVDLSVTFVTAAAASEACDAM